MCVQIAAKKGRPSTSQLITGVAPVTFCAGSSVSDHSGVPSAKFRWWYTWVVRLRGASAESDRRHTCNQLTGTRPAFFSRYLNVRLLLVVPSPPPLVRHTTHFASLLWGCNGGRGYPPPPPPHPSDPVVWQAKNSRLYHNVSIRYYLSI